LAPLERTGRFPSLHEPLRYLRDLPGPQPLAGGLAIPLSSLAAAAALARRLGLTDLGASAILRPGTEGAVGTGLCVVLLLVAAPSLVEVIRDVLHQRSRQS
jgi:hypothetical protein